eukprot:EG_transcript_45308
MFLPVSLGDDGRRRGRQNEGSCVATEVPLPNATKSDSGSGSCNTWLQNQRFVTLLNFTQTAAPLVTWPYNQKSCECFMQKTIHGGSSLVKASGGGLRTGP